MTIRKKLSMGIGVLMTLFLALGVISYFQIDQIDENLTEIIRGKTLGRQAVFLHRQCTSLDDDLAKTRDAQNALFAEVTGSLARLETSISEELPDTTNSRQQDQFNWIDETSLIDKEIAHVARVLAIYLRTPDKEHQEQVFNAAATVDRRLRQLKSLPLTEQQNHSLLIIEGQFSQAVSLIRQIVALNSHISNRAAEYKEIRNELDKLLSPHFSQL